MLYCTFLFISIFSFISVFIAYCLTLFIALCNFGLVIMTLHVVNILRLTVEFIHFKSVFTFSSVDLH